MTASLADGKNTVVTPEATPISRPPSSVPGRLPRPPTMIATKLGMISESPMVGCRPSMAGGQHAGEAGQIDAEAEIEVAQDAHIDAEHRDRLEIERAGADAQTEPRAVRGCRNRPSTDEATIATMNRR